ncbi:MAG: protein kinase [Candidatus Obscuribacterales bacterium]|nr:protein kinase [Candidatus Obscuribacterales bacterium]
MQPGDFVGQIIDDKYQIESLIGFGGMGSVYLCRHLELDRMVAVKLLLPELFNNAESVARFEREAQILSSIRHPNVVEFYSWGYWHSHPYLVMEYLQGESLRSWMDKQGKIAWKTAAVLGIAVCKALSALHNNGIVHRDLTPNNIFLLSDVTEIKLIDFGLARAVESAGKQTLTRTGALIGSVHYLSPEICEGKKAISQSDIYSLGCILYELIAGKKALDCDNPVGLVFKHANEYPPSLVSVANVPEVIDNIVFKAIRKPLTERYASADALEDDLEAVCTSEFSAVAIEKRKNSKQPKNPVVILATITTLSLFAITFVRLTTTKTQQDEWKAQYAPTNESAEIGHRDNGAIAVSVKSPTALNSVPYVISLVKAAKELMGSGQWQEALTELKKAENALSEPKTEKARGLRLTVLADLANTAYEMNNLHDATGYAKRSLAELEGKDDKVSRIFVIAALQQLGFVEKRRGKLQSAQNFFEEALHRWFESDQRFLRPAEQAQLAQLLLNAGKTADSVAMAATAVAAIAKSSSPTDKDCYDSAVATLVVGELKLGKLDHWNLLIEPQTRQLDAIRQVTIRECLGELLGSGVPWKNPAAAAHVLDNLLRSGMLEDETRLHALKIAALCKLSAKQDAEFTRLAKESIILHRKNPGKNGDLLPFLELLSIAPVSSRDAGTQKLVADVIMFADDGPNSTIKGNGNILNFLTEAMINSTKHALAQPAELESLLDKVILIHQQCKNPAEFTVGKLLEFCLAHHSANTAESTVNTIIKQEKNKFGSMNTRISRWDELLGPWYESNKNYDKAMAAYARCAKASPAGSPNQAQWFLDAARMAILLQDPHRKSFVAEAIASTDRIAQDTDKTQALRRLAEVLIALQDFEPASAAIEKALAIQKIRKPEQTSERLNLQLTKSTILIAKGRLKEAEGIANSILHDLPGIDKTLAAKENGGLRLRCLWNCLSAQLLQNDSKGAAKTSSELFMELKKTKDQSARLISYRFLGMVYAETGRLSEAEKIAQEGLKVFKAGNYPAFYEASLKLTLAECFAAKGKRAEAQESLEQVRKHFEKETFGSNGVGPTMLLSASALARVHRKLGQSGEAARYEEQANDLRKKWHLASNHG